MTPSQLTEYAGGFVEQTLSVAELVNTLIDMGYGVDAIERGVPRAAAAIAEFERQTGARAADLIGPPWAVIGGRVFVADQGL